jgi:uncharacterized protein
MDNIRVGASLLTLFLGLITGTAFGLVIYKVGASKYENILAMLRLKKMMILKFMMVTVIVASIGVYALAEAGVISLTIKPVWLAAQITGGALFGIGFALLGYCPGTAVVAAGEGKKDALFGVLGGIFGSALFAHFWPSLSATLIKDSGPLTVPSALSISNWSGVVLMVAMFGAVLLGLEALESKKSGSQKSGTETGLN